MVLLTALTLLAAPKPLMRDFMGLNTHTVQFRTELYRPTTRLVRNYHPVEWDLGADLGAPNFPKTHNGVDWSQLYGDWKKAGYGTLASIMFESIGPEKWDAQPARAAEYGEAFARALGPSGKTPLIEAAEIGNEPTKVSDAQYRRIFEKMAKGIRKGDPKLKIATCAVAVGKEDAYSRDLAVFEGLEPYIDALNVHTYAFVEGWPTWKRSYPEDPKINYLKQVEAVIGWRNRRVPGRPVWVTEFGYDSSTKPAPATGDFSKWVGVSDAQQAQYIVRSYLTFATMDVDRAYLFWFNDEDQPQLHGSSGLTRNYQPKPSFYAVRHLYQSLGDYRLARVVRKDDEAWVLEFLSPKKGAERVWVAWRPTGDEGSKVVTLPKLPGKVVLAEGMPLTDGKATVPQPKVRKDGTAELSLSGSPSYLWFRSR